MFFLSPFTLRLGSSCCSSHWRSLSGSSVCSLPFSVSGPESRVSMPPPKGCRYISAPSMSSTGSDQNWKWAGGWKAEEEGWSGKMTGDDFFLIKRNTLLSPVQLLYFLNPYRCQQKTKGNQQQSKNKKGLSTSSLHPLLFSFPLFLRRTSK